MDIDFRTEKQRSGFTTLEMVIVLGVILILVTVTVVGTQVYTNASNEAACVINQDTIRTAIIAQANLREERLVPGIDYFLDPDLQASFGGAPECPAIGSYTAFVDPDSGELVVTCIEHGHGD